MSDRDYYCRNKFTFLKIDAEQQTTYNCHAAAPHRINVEWLRSNPGQIFNTDINIAERQMMLLNQRNKSCEQNCYRAEDIGAVGPRIIEGGPNRTHTDVTASPEIIDLTISSECNLTCSYCCREFSSAWRRDLENHGPYENLGPRYQLGSRDLIIKQFSQAQRQQAEISKLVHQEISLAASSLNRLTITGGEPFLNNYLVKIIKDYELVKQIKLFTGLGVNSTRFGDMISQLSDCKNLIIAVSMENIEALHEFNRNGSKWATINRNLSTLMSSGLPVMFHSTLTNLTIHGFVEFYLKFQQYPIEFDIAHQPDFMPIYVIDPDSKHRILDQLSSTNIKKLKLVIDTLDKSPTEQQIKNTHLFLTQFVNRRPGLLLTVFPETFLKWLDINVV